MDNEYIFVYGTLREKEIFERVTGINRNSLVPAKLYGIKKSRLFSGYNIYDAVYRSDDDDFVYGMVVKVEDEHLFKMDRYEGGLYSRIKWLVNIEESDNLSAKADGNSVLYFYEPTKYMRDHSISFEKKFAKNPDYFVDHSTENTKEIIYKDNSPQN